MNIKQFESNLENVQMLSPHIFKNSMKISIPFFILHKKIFDYGDKLLKENFSLNQSELDILAALYYMTDETFTMSPTKLYDVMLFSSGGMTKVLKKLESKNYIQRVNNIEDKRSKLVQLTTLGKEITVKALDEVVSFEDSYFSKLNEKEQEQLHSLLLKILK